MSTIPHENSQADPVTVQLTPPAEGVGQRATKGLAWLMLQTAVAKIINTLTTFITAWYLLAQDYKIAALAFPITMFVSVFQQLGVDKVLISRGKEFKQWANAGFWMSSMAGLVCGGLILGLAPIAAYVYHTSELWSILAILALGGPLNGMTSIHQAWLQHQLKFKLLAILGAFSTLVQALLTIYMAWHGYGVYALVVPVTGAGLVRFAVLWATVKLPLRLNPEFRQWRFLIQDGLLALATQFVMLISSQGDFVLLGFLLPPKSPALGYFSFAFAVSLSLITPLVMNLGTVLFPALSSMRGETARQTDAFLRASGKLALIGVPLCLLQAAIAAPLLHAFYGDKWDEAIRPIQILSICMAIRVVCVTAGALIFAQGRFLFMFWMCTIYGISFLGAVWLGASLGGIATIALAEAIFFILFDNINLYLALRPARTGIRPIVRLYAAPLGAAGMSLAVAISIVHFLTPSIGNWMQAGLTTLIMLTTYGLILMLIAPQSIHEAIQLARGMFSHKSKNLG